MKKPKFVWPMLFGIDHFEGGGKGMEEKLDSVAESGARCFIECPPKIAKLYNEGGAILATGSSNPTTYLKLMDWLHKRGVELIALDRDSIIRLRKRASKDEDAEWYIMSILREDSWRNTIRARAKQGDFVIMHPGHLERVIRRWRIPKDRHVFVDKVGREWKYWTGAAVDRSMRAKRKRAIRRQTRAR